MSLGELQAVSKSRKSLPGRCENALYTFLPDGVSFVSPNAFSVRTMYFPLCGADARGIKSSITPRLGGDIKIDKERYLTKPVSAEDLRQDLRNFFCFVEPSGRNPERSRGTEWTGVFSITDGSTEDTSVEAGLLWHRFVRRHAATGLELEALNFVPVTGENAELMRVTVKNTSRVRRRITPTFCLPIFGRPLANKHDHEHVTSLLHRIRQLPGGICVEPVMIFDERGHRPNETVYYVLGTDAQGKSPVGTFPTAESFYGDGGNISAPEAVMGNVFPTVLNEEEVQGKEAVGALRFGEEDLPPGAAQEYLIVMGISSGREGMDAVFDRFNTPAKLDAALEQNKAQWLAMAQTIQFTTGDRTFDAWMHWVTVQPVLRRIFGCSFLPEHDYGRGGRGWRDLWQDLLSLILIEPENARETLIGNFAGVRVDGSNATIIGPAAGEFIADRNAITRVWTDHGAWPLATLLLYIHQTGDYGILLEESTYFRDGQISRASGRDPAWVPEHGNFLKDKNGNAYRGSVLEHILIQHLVQFFNVGEHNIMRLEDADWNDGLDMGRERGESVAFMSFYGGNLLALADLLENLSTTKGIEEVGLAAEVKTLLDSLLGMSVDYNDPRVKKKFLSEIYFPSVQPEISGEKIAVPVHGIVKDLRRKGNWIFGHIRANDKITVMHGGRTHSWFNGYYDNRGACVEGLEKDRVRMTLTGQVFAVMSGLADENETEDVIRAVRHYLQDKRTGGFRLNTDFGLTGYPDLGRAFGFAYGTKENGSFFSHMTVMYAYALYKQGFVREGYDVLCSVYRMCMDTGKSKVYPGIPEYFDSQGRGHYHYLTGAASWLVLTRLTQVFGVRGEGGDLLLAPQLVKEEFDAQTATAAAACRFAGKKISVVFENPGKLDHGDYGIREVFLNGETVGCGHGRMKRVKIKRGLVENSPPECSIRVVLDAVS